MKANSIIKRVFSLLLTVIMLFSCWVFVVPTNAASAGNYYVKVWCESDNNTGGWNSHTWTISGKDTNGTGSSGTIATVNDTKLSGSDTVWEGTTKYFPTSASFTYDFGGLATVRNLKIKIHIQVGSSSSNLTQVAANSDWQTAQSGWFSAAKGTKSTSVGSGNYPKASSTSISGGSNVSVPTGSGTNYSSAFSAGTVYDQYGVSWYQDASLSSNKAGGTGFSNSKISVTADNNRADNYSVTVTASCGSASASTSVTITVFDYIVIFNDWDGTQLIKQTGINYNSSATAPSSPSRGPDSTNHYAFKSWSGTYTNLTSGAQTKTVTASYTGTAHSGWVYSPISGDHSNHTKKCGSCTYSTTAAHTYGATTITFGSDGTTATATRVCTTTGCSHSQTETANVTSKVKTAATCTEKGWTTYTATSPFDGDTATDSVDKQDIAALGHSWKTPTFEWSNDCSSCTATRECTRNSSHKETKTVTQIDEEEVAASTCTVNGSTKYTAHSPWDDGTTNEKTLVDIPALGHNWKPTVITFAADGKTATATRTCNRDASHEETLAAPVSHVEKTPATCTEKGWTTYTATSPFAGDTATKSVDKEDIAALGHDWNPVTFEFAADGKTATATRVCRTDGEHVESAAAIMSHAVKTPATCEGDGTTTYTATSPWGDGATASVDKVDIAAIGHSWGDWEDLGENGHRRVCANDASHIESSATHTYSSYSKDLPEDETILAKLEAAGFNGETQCYRYCTACNNVEIQNHNYTHETTKERKCTEGGLDTYTCEYCHTSYTKETDPLGHDRKPESVAPDDNTEGYECFHCTRCGNYWAAVYNEDTKNYDVLNPETTGEKDVANVKGGSTPVPAPYFNYYATDPSEEGFYYDYSYRDSSLKLMKDAYVDTENTRQDFRFSGAVTIPEGVSYKVDPSKNVNEVNNVILDFGFVYTQDWYNQGENSGYGAAKLTLENVAKYSTGYAKMSVVENNHNDKIDNGAFNGSNWSGVTYHPKTAVRDVETLTFNLVISMKAKNWKKQYAARPYITYKYHGVVYTVYDGGASDQSVTYSFGSVYAIAAASISTNKDKTSEVVLDYVKKRIIANRDALGTDAATDWWRWFNEYESYEENVNNPNSLYNWYLSELEAL